MAPYKVEEVSTRDELDEIANCILAAMGQKDDAYKVFFPVLSDPQTALDECKGRLWNEHVSDPSSHWVFVRDASSQSLRVLGACQWRFYEQNPFPHGAPEILATWWPEGEGRDFGTEFVGQCMAPRATWMARPHAGLSWCVVLPEYQQRGIGQAIMSWGIRRMDELGLESYIEATSVGRRLYERCGYRAVARVDIDMEGKGGGEEWGSLESSFLPSGYDAMWRPPRGIWEEGEPERTWRARLDNTQDS